MRLSVRYAKQDYEVSTAFLTFFSQIWMQSLFKKLLRKHADNYYQLKC